MKHKKSVIIVAGGKGLRMKTDTPKQFIEVAGMPILMHTIKLFHQYDPIMEIILVLPEEHVLLWENLCTEYHFKIPHQLTNGGSTRFHSVLNGINATNEPDLIAIHDGVRPLVNLETIKACFDAAHTTGAAIPTGECTESLRQLDENNSYALDRSKFKTVQTPQVFNSTLLKQAYQQPYSPLFTDDASVVESLWATHNNITNSKITLINGNTENIKITTQLDLIIAKELLKQQTNT